MRGSTGNMGTTLDFISLAEAQVRNHLSTLTFVAKWGQLVFLRTPRD